MALSNQLASQLAKVINADKDEDKAVTVKGTYKSIGSVNYVQIDGSDILTPVDMLVDAEDGERVTVEIGDHDATVTGNISSPMARSKDVSDLADTVDEYGNTIQQMDNTIIQQNNSIIQINNSINEQNNTINQHENKINEFNDTIISMNNTINEQGNTIQLINNDISAQGDKITSMNNTITEQGDNITSMNNTIQSHGNSITEISNTIEQQGNLISQQGNLISQQDNTIKEINDTIVSQGNTIVAQGNTIDAHETQLITHNSEINILNSAFTIKDGVLTGLSDIIVDNLKSDTLDTGYAKIDFANIQMAAVEKLFSDSGIIKDLIVEDGAIAGELVGVTIKGDLIEGNTIVADKLVVKGEDGLYYKLNTNGETIESQQTDENSLNGSVITAKSVTASKIQVDDLVAFGATIGGFDISDSSINTHLKTTVQSPDEGLYLGADGQVALGDDLNYIKYYKDENNNFILDVRLDKLYLGSSKQTVDQQITSTVELSADNLTSTFKSSGGSNLLRNSVGYSGTDFWDTSGTVSTNQDDDMSLSGSEFILSDKAYIEQYYNTQPGTKYSVSFKYKHKALGTAGNVKVVITGNGSDITLLDSSDVKSEWTSVSMEEPYTATSTSQKIKISVDDDDTFEITDLLVSQGTNDVWSGYVDELYGKQHQLDRNGLRLYSESSNNSSNTTSTSYQLKSGSTVVGELTKDRVYSDSGEFNKSTKIGKLKTIVLDENNIIEYI